MASDRRPLPLLPLEIWIRIIASVSDERYLPRTWLNCRRVSHAFKAATEMAFVDVQLPALHILVEIGELLRLDFHGLTENRNRATYKEMGSLLHPIQTLTPRQDQVRESEEKRTSEAWWREHDSYLTCLRNGAPSILYVTVLRGFVEDIEFPGLEMDIPAKELSFLWKPMLSTFFGEIEYRKWVLRRHCELEKLGQQATKTPKTRWGKASAQADTEETAAAPKSPWNLTTTQNVELRVRTLRRRNHAWDERFKGHARQLWQVKALTGYRTPDGCRERDGLQSGEDEEGWGTFYDRPGMDYGNLLFLRKRSWKKNSTRLETDCDMDCTDH